TITDQGKGFRIDQVAGKIMAADEGLLSSGRGLLIMQAFLDDVRYELGGRRVILTLRRDSGSEKRVYARVAVQVRVRLIPILQDQSLNWDAAFDAIARNFSHGGVTIVRH